MVEPIKTITIEGFKSIRQLREFELRRLNVLIGANGAGKSNFVELFRLIRAMADENLQSYILKAGGGDGVFFDGPKATPKLTVRLAFGQYGYGFNLEPTNDGRVLISDESISDGVGAYASVTRPHPAIQLATGIGMESGLSVLSEPLGIQGTGRQVYRAVSEWTVYHFHDTSSLAPIRREQTDQDTQYLRADASNIAAFLLVMRVVNKENYELIRDTIRLVAPFFDDFLLKPRKNGNGIKVALDWRQKGSDFPFQPWHLSDGTLRFICLVTALLQPKPPPTLVIDEPELGLHPHALEILAGLLQKTSQRAQVIVSTQSAPLLSQFEPEDVITVTRKDGASVFGRLDRAALAEWMKDYTLGELWQKNVIDAGASDD